MIQASTHLAKSDAGPGIAPHFVAAADDLIIVPVAVNAVAIKNVLHAAFVAIVRTLDFAFPLFLQLARIPLFTLRIIGDGTTAVLGAVINLLPLSPERREAWRAWIGTTWAALRKKISYRAFEQWVHNAFERGMAWVFQTCGTLSPRNALLVICGAMLWLPISFGAATAVHITLLAKAASLPAWMQLFHPVAACLAKSKLLTLPVYPAAWPQARQHPLVQALLAAYRRFAAFHLVRKTGHRYGQAERALWAELTFAAQPFAGLSAHFAKQSQMAVAAWSAFLRRAADELANLPLAGAVVRRYSAHYEAVDAGDEPLSKRTGALLRRWSIKFSADYYAARAREEAALAPVTVDTRAATRYSGS